jgi:pyruvate dehydrogenase (quinone)
MRLATTVADYSLERRREWGGVGQVFVSPGDGINGLVAARGRAESMPQFVQSRHEEMSAFEAVGFAKFSGKVEVCAATSGPGAIHLLNGLYDAKPVHVPVVAIVGQTERSAMGAPPTARRAVTRSVRLQVSGHCAPRRTRRSPPRHTWPRP